MDRLLICLTAGLRLRIVLYLIKRGVSNGGRAGDADILLFRTLLPLFMTISLFIISLELGSFMIVGLSDLTFRYISFWNY